MLPTRDPPAADFGSLWNVSTPPWRTVHVWVQFFLKQVNNHNLRYRPKPCGGGWWHMTPITPTLQTWKGRTSPEGETGSYLTFLPFSHTFVLLRIPAFSKFCTCKTVWVTILCKLCDCLRDTQFGGNIIEQWKHASYWRYGQYRYIYHQHAFTLYILNCKQLREEMCNSHCLKSTETL